MINASIILPELSSCQHQMWVNNKLWISLVVISLKKAKAHMTVEPKGVDGCNGNNQQEISFEFVITLSCTINLDAPHHQGQQSQLGNQGRTHDHSLYVCIAAQYNSSSDKLLGTQTLHLLALTWLYVSSIIPEVNEKVTNIVFQIAIPNISTVDLAQLEKGVKNTYVHCSVIYSCQGVEVTKSPWINNV